MMVISTIFEIGQPQLWMTISRAGVSSPVIMKFAGVNIDVESRLAADMPDYVARLRQVAEHPVAAALMYHNTVHAFMSFLPRFDPADGDGGVWGRVKAYVGMTEEQKRLMLHCHLLVWVHGFTSFAALRDELDDNHRQYEDLAKFFSRVILNQIASREDVDVCLRGQPECDVSSPADHLSAARDASVCHAKKCLIPDVDWRCLLVSGEEWCADALRQYGVKIHADMADITSAVNLHKRVPACFSKAHRCR